MSDQSASRSRSVSPPPEVPAAALWAGRLAARDWADDHGHEEPPDDRMLAVHAVPIFAAGVAAGRTQAAAELAATFKRIADSERESLVSTPPEYFEEQVRYRARSVAFARAAEIAEGSDG